MKKEEYLSLIDEVIAQGSYTDTWDSLCEHPVPKWYARDKFGIFIHWGVYSVPAFGNEWYPRNMYIKGSKENLHHEEKYGTLDKFGYKDFIPQFKAEKFDPKEWAELFKEAGAKFVVPVAEHHDGFQMYASDLCRWNAAEMGPKRDILGELKTEVEKEGMVLGASTHRAEHYWFFNGGRLNLMSMIRSMMIFTDRQQESAEISVAFMTILLQRSICRTGLFVHVRL